MGDVTASGMRGLRRGALLWLAVGVVGIALRGVRWEESYERAQAMLGIIPYDHGHPLYVYGWNAFSIHYYLSALVMRVWDSPLLVCGVRDLLCVWAALLPVYFLGARVARNPWGGHLAAAFILANAHQIFRSYYSINVWPFMFTSGEIGFGWALGVAAGWAWGRWGLGFFMLGMMPVVHIGQMPPVLAVGIAMAAGLLVYGQPEERRRMVLGLGAGLAVTALFVVLHHFLHAPYAADGPYAASGDGIEVWKRFTFYEDIHRRPGVPPRFGPFAHSQLALLALPLLTIGWMWRHRARQDSPPKPVNMKDVAVASVFFHYALACCGAVWIASAGQGLIGPDTPFWLIGWLPYRLPNHAGALLVALSAGMALSGRARGVALVAVAWLALAPLGAWILPEAVQQRYIAPTEGPLFLLLGGVFAAVGVELRDSPGFLRGCLAACAAVWAYAAWHNQFLAALVVCGAGAYFVLAAVGSRVRSPYRLPEEDGSRVRSPYRGVALAIALVVAGQLAKEYQTREHLPRDAFEQEARAYLQAHAAPEDVLLAPFTTINYQEKLGQPVFATFETYLFIPYLRDIAPTIEQMLTDAYGIRFGEPWSQDVSVWERRTPEEWQALGERYDIAYVLAPKGAHIALEPVLEGGRRVLYRIAP
ncbi:MAG: hypothetical protein GC168_05750 [Candidatus Hydrogenedens sp.]|nr:hypothetical protein [Candidatus Hydrogenedens sp.]